MDLIQRILCPFDVESPAGSALQYAFAFADRFHASIDVVHACSPGYAKPFEPLSARLDGRASEQRLRERLEKALRAVTSAIPGRATAHIIDGRPVAALLAHSRRNKFDLMVIGSRRSRDAGFPFPPGVGETVAHHARCAVLSLCESAASAPQLPSFNRGLLAIDFSETTDVLVEWAAALGRRFGAGLHLVHVDNAFEPSRPILAVRRPDRPPGAIAYRLESIAERLARRGVRVEFSTVSDGLVPDRLLEYASFTRSDLIMLGAHGSRLARADAIRGVVAEVRRRSPVPVLSVRTSRAEALFASPAGEEFREFELERAARLGCDWRAVRRAS